MERAGLGWAGLLPPEAGSRGIPLVLVERDRGALRITAADPQALALSLPPGLVLADAWARVPGLVALPAQPEEDSAFLARLAAWCERFTPLVALDAPDGLLLDVTGCPPDRPARLTRETYPRDLMDGHCYKPPNA